MIKPGEIQNRARAFGIRDQQIEKDYILSWILQGVAHHLGLSKAIVFKGGTALKKVYFEDYRFSEDLDFTLLDPEISNAQIFRFFEEVFRFVKNESNIDLEIVDNNEHSDGGINFYISYTGPLGGLGNRKKVKVDISRSELMVFEPANQPVLARYSDQGSHFLICYPLEEILVEKLRSVIQRMQARDFYDIWYLLEIQGMDAAFYLSEFRSKCDAKSINPQDFFMKLEKRLPQYKARWNSSLADQIRDLPAFEQVDREVSRGLRNFSP